MRFCSTFHEHDAALHYIDRALKSYPRLCRLVRAGPWLAVPLDPVLRERVKAIMPHLELETFLRKRGQSQDVACENVHLILHIHLLLK
jgi:hypothetical protein